MNILFEFITVSVKTGAGEYHRRIFYELVNKVENSDTDDTVFALYDSRKGIAYEDLSPEALKPKQCVRFIDCADKSIDQIVEEHHIDTFFIACAQYLRDRDEIQNIKCKVICVIHDIVIEELVHNKLITYMQLFNTNSYRQIALKPWQRFFCKKFLPECFRYMDNFAQTHLLTTKHNSYDQVLGQLNNIVALHRNNHNTQLVTVSQHSRASVIYYYNLKKDDIKVLYSPERCTTLTDKVENEELKKLIDSGNPYYLMVSSKIEHKNAYKVIRAFEKFQKLHPEAKLVTLGTDQQQYPAQIPLPFLSDGDLANAYKHCYAFMYPSYTEGFGYPPLECMRFGKPVLASNTSSIPEVLGNAPIYFSPFYESEIFRALCDLTSENYTDRCQASQNRFKDIHSRQERDLHTLIDMITSK